MAEPTVTFLIQAITLLTCITVFRHLFISTFLFLFRLDAHAPSVRRLRRKMEKLRRSPARKKRRAGKKKRFREKMKKKKRNIPKLTHLLAAALRVGCCVERALRIAYLRARRAAHSFHSTVLKMKEKTAVKVSDRHSSIIVFQASTGEDLPTYLARFDTDSFRIGVDTLCTRTLSGNKDHFEDLQLYRGQKVTGISGGLEIAGQGTFVFRIQSDDGIVDTIKIPHSLYVPGIELPLLSPQHWAETAKDNAPIKFGTKIEADEEGCTLLWKQQTRRKRVLHDPLTKTPIFRTAPGTRRYQAFEATFMACDASHLRNHISLNLDRLRTTDLDPAEFIAEENIHLPEKEIKASEKVHEDDDTVKTSNTSSSVQQRRQQAQEDRIGPLTFSPTPKLSDAELLEHSTAAEDDQAELMRWHYRLGHLSFEKLKQLAKNGEIPKKLAKTTPPRCAGCLFGAMTKVPWRTRGPKSNKQVFTATRPGQVVSVDQLISTQPGFVAQLKGKLTTQRYKAATIFVDHFSGLRYIHLMTGTSSAETVKAKQAFEQFAANHLVHIEHYHADNGRFADNAFISHCSQRQQRLTYCGVNAHFQNGVAERAIRDITEGGRKQLLHAMARWPQVVDLALWPYALRYAVHIYNIAPVMPDGSSRLELFSGTRVGVRMRDQHTFACPVFALQNNLAAGKSLPRWSPRARLGLNLGPSPFHARNVYLVLNLSTGLVSPQYHCRFDDLFETVRLNGPDVTTTAIWRQLAGFRRADGTPTAPAPQEFISEVTVPPTQRAETAQDDRVESMQDFESINDVEFPHDAPTDPMQDSEGAVPADAVLPDAGTSSHGRQRKMSRAMAESVSQRDFYGNKNMYYMANQGIAHEQTEADLFHDSHLELQERMENPMAFHAEMMGDIMYYHQAIKQPDAQEFVKAVVNEVEAHVRNKHWELVRRDQVPSDTDILPAIWAMRRKRNLTTNEVKGHKARLNIHGGKQVYGANYYETYAPVVTWFAVRFMLVLAILHGWAMRQVDFVQAYAQAPIECDMYMELPPGIETKHGNSKDYVLKLLANLYGQKQAGRVWNQYMTDKLRDIGFQQSQIDECVFYRDDIIFIVYVDDGLFFGSDDDVLTQVISKLKEAGLNIEDQGHPADYVGVNIKKAQDGTYELTQRALIDAIIDDVNIGNAYTKPVPAKVSLQLHAFRDSPKFDGNFNYRSVVGKLNYLSQTTRPDIMYAVHQVAKYSADPRVEHGEAIVYIIKYLKATRHIGLRFQPDPSKGFQCYCDADFTGNWNREFASNDPSTAKSRSGWIIFYAACPIIWASKLQTQVALSTTEAEYIAMSMALRDVIPLLELIKEMRERKFDIVNTQPYVYCKVFEDNSGALELARLPRLRPRTKHINVCYHHFREHVRKGLIKIFPIDTKDQIADTLTKALAQNDFARHRKKMCGL